MGGLVELGRGRVLASQNIAYTGTSAQAATPFTSQSYQARLCADSACYYTIGNGTLTAHADGTVNSVFLPASFIEYVMVTPGESIAVVRAGTDGLVTATSGTLNVVELG